MPPPRVFEALGLVVREDFLDAGLCARVAAIARARAGEQPAEVGTGASGSRIDQAVRRVWEIDLPPDVEAELTGRLERLRPAIESVAAPISATRSETSGAAV